MIKQVALLKTKEGMSYDAFVRRYEEGHAPLCIKVIPQIAKYHRNFVIPGSMVALEHVGAAAAKPFFDVVTEVWFENQAKLDELSNALAKTNVGAIIAEDETHLFDRSQMIMFAAEERFEPTKLRTRPVGFSGRPAKKMICIMRKKPGMSRDAFIDYYENGHSKLALKLLVKGGEPLFAEYSRTYPTPGGQFDLAHVKGPAAKLDFDVMTKINFWADADYQEFSRQCTDPKIGAALTKDEENLFDRDSIRMFMVEERTTSEAEFKAQAKARGAA